MKGLYQKGYSILEILLAVAIVGIILVIATYSFSGLKNSQAMKNATGDISSATDKARSEAFASVASSEYGVHFQSNKVVIFKGTAYNASSSTNETINISSPASITNVTLNGVSGTSGDVYFNKLTGTPSKTGTVTVTVSSTTKTITISATGGISTN